jgi:hypothetical protein
MLNTISQTPTEDSNTPNSAQSTTGESIMLPSAGQDTPMRAGNETDQSQTASNVNTSGTIHRPALNRLPKGAIPTGKERYTRPVKATKDIIVTASSIILNRVLLVEYQLLDGKTKEFPARDYLGNYNFLEDYNTWSTDHKKEFWQAKDGSWLEVQVDISSIGSTSKTNPVVEMLRKLGPEAYDHAQFLFVSLVWPNAPKKIDSVVFLPLGYQIIDSDSPPIGFDAHLGLTFLSALAQEIDKFKSTKNVGVLIRTPASDPRLISLPQLLHALPFCELNFKKWGLWSQPKSFMQAIRVDHESEALLNCEWRKICQAGWEENRGQELPYEQYVSSVAEGTPSLDPTVYSIQRGGQSISPGI